MRRNYKEMPHQLQPQSNFILILFLLLLLAIEGLARTTTEKAPVFLKIGVPANSPYPEYVHMKCNQNSSKCFFDGFSIRLFKLILRRLRYNKPYKFIPYNGTSYDSLVEQVSSKTFDAAVGDVSIVANRTKYVDFSLHYTEMGVRMVVLAEPEAGKAWIFVKPFTKPVWAMIGLIFLYNGIIVRWMERAGNEELEGPSSVLSRLGSLVWLSFTTFFPYHEGNLRRNLSRLTMVVWLFVALVLMQSYTANLTSMLTAHRLKPSVLDVETLRRSSAKVGCDHGSFIESYLQKVLNFSKSRIETYTSGDDYAGALKSGKIKAAFLELAFIKIFLQKNNKGFAVTGPKYDIGGYGFAFSKGSPLVGDVTGEILRLRENGNLSKLEACLLGSSSSSMSTPSAGETDSQELDNDGGRLSLESFSGLFIITGATSTLALFLFEVRRHHNNWRKHKNQIQHQILPDEDLDLIGTRDHHDTHSFLLHTAVELQHLDRSKTL